MRIPETNFKLGMGVITTSVRRPLWREANLKLTPSTELIVFEDRELKGVAYGRNECIKYLYDAGCDYIAIADDDLIYHVEGWLELCAGEMDWTDGMAFACLPHVIEGNRIETIGAVESWDAYIGAFYILSRRVVEEVGYFSPAFKGYGWEDVHYKKRLTNVYGRVYNPISLPYLVSSMDVLGLSPVPSIPNKAEQVAFYEKIYEQEIRNGVTYYPYPNR